MLRVDFTFLMSTTGPPIKISKELMCPAWVRRFGWETPADGKDYSVVKRHHCVFELSADQTSTSMLENLRVTWGGVTFVKLVGGNETRRAQDNEAALLTMLCRTQSL